VGSVFFNVIGQYLIKSGIGKIGISSFSAVTMVKTIFTPLVFAGFMAYAVSSIFWIMALAKQELSVAYPVLLGMGLIAVVVVSWIFLNEEVSVMRLIGVLLIALGIYFIMKSS